MTRKGFNASSALEVRKSESPSARQRHHPIVKLLNPAVLFGGLNSSDASPAILSILLVLGEKRRLRGMFCGLFFPWSFSSPAYRSWYPLSSVLPSLGMSSYESLMCSRC